MKLNKFVLPVIGLMLSSSAAYADAIAGKILHDQSCMGCHDTSVYSRPDKGIKTAAALQAQVSRCTKPAGAEWSKQDVMDVVEYLNKDFYHFK